MQHHSIINRLKYKKLRTFFKGHRVKFPQLYTRESPKSLLCVAAQKSNKKCMGKIRYSLLVNLNASIKILNDF